MSQDEYSTKLDLERIVFIGRSFEEYMEMFSLSFEELQGRKILDCPAGACSFTAVGNNRGLNITACDIAYYHSGENLEIKGLLDIEHAMEHMEKVKNNYIWEYFKSVEDLRKNRLTALENCTADMKENVERYVAVNLPSLPFKNEEFDLLLSAHFLFMYSDRLDFQFHLDTLRELLRVTKHEIRIFPVVDLEGKRYKHIKQIVSYLSNKGYAVEEVQVTYEFQSHANTMLIIKK